MIAMEAIPPSLAVVIIPLNIIAAVLSLYLSYLSYRARKIGFRGMYLSCISFAVMSIAFLASIILVLMLSSPPRAPPRIWMPELVENRLFVLVQSLYTMSYLIYAYRMTWKSGLHTITLLLPPLPSLVMLYILFVSWRRTSHSAKYSYAGLAISHLLTTLSILFAKPWLLVLGELIRPLSLVPLVQVLRASRVEEEI